MIRKAEIRDLETVVKFRLEMIRSLGRYDELKDTAFQDILKAYKKMYEDDKLIHYIMEDNYKIVSVVGVMICEEFPTTTFKDDKYAYILDLYTLKNFRKKGYATILIKSCIGWAEDRGIKSVKLKVATDAKKIYIDLGFSTTNEMELKI